MSSSSVFVLIDDKHIPLYRILWIADVPHFCGDENCQCEGDYEVRLEADESVWASRTERDSALLALESWYNGQDPSTGGESGPEGDKDWP